MQHWNFSYRTNSKTQRARDFPLIWKNLCGHRALVFFLLPVSTMKYFTCKPKQRQRELFVLRKEINTSETGRVSRNICFNQAMGSAGSWFSSAEQCWDSTKQPCKQSELLQVCLAQSCKTLVSCSCQLLEFAASEDIQAEPSSSASNSPSAAAIYNITFVPLCQYLIQEMNKSYKHRKVSISH